MNLVADIEFSALILIKIATLLFLLFYLVFAGVVIKQAKIMTETIQTGFEGPIKGLVFAHFVFALVTLFLAIIIL
jgi:hypothetical protein